MITLILIALIVSGITTIIHFKRQNDRMQLERLQQKEHSIMLALNYYIIENNIESVNAKLENKVQELSDINLLDLNVFDTHGQLLGSTNMEIFENEGRPLLLPDSVIHQLNTAEDRLVIREEIKDLEYLSTYFYLVSPENKNIAIVNLPYLKSEEQSQRDLLRFLGTLGQIYVLLFLGAALLAYFLSSYITKSLSTIRKKLESFRINAQNEKLEWNSHDEIGALVNTYNLMVDELEQSAEKLAKSEREMAWKEMAKQVAHEIKNPLTPMRLSIQHLQRKLKDRPEEADEIMKRFSNTMLEQIDTLSRIATEFSNFAKMPKAKLEPLNIVGIVESVQELYTSEYEGTINIQLENQLGKHQLIYADKEQMLRVFGNLVKNAIQAFSAPESGKITISLREQENRIIAAVKDNGKGISAETIDKIFTPSFTTKSSGMGLGLAMVKNIVTGIGATIWFDTEENKGTTFYISFPIYHPLSKAKH